MEPGHEDREYATEPKLLLPDEIASMEPGHEDREYGPVGHHRRRD